MPAPVSVIIPAKQATAELPGCLSALFAGVEAGLVREVIVSSVPSNDIQLREIAERTGAVWIEGAEGRGSQMKTGAEAARGDWLLFLHADTWLGPNWPDIVSAHLGAHAGMAGAFRLKFRSKTKRARIVEGLTNWRARTFGMPYGDQGLLISRKLYDEVGGFDPVPLMEDVMMVRKIGKARLCVLDEDAATSGQKQERDGWFLRSLQNLLLLLRFLLGADPKKLARLYYK